MRDLALLTRDLRVADNPVLVAAGQTAIPLFVADPQTESLSRSPNRMAYLTESLVSLDCSLRDLGSSLVYRRGEWLSEIQQVVKEADADRLHVARDVSEFAQKRISALRRKLDVPVVEHTSTTAVNLTALSPASAAYYQRFTPYFNRWISVPRRSVLPAPSDLLNHGLASDAIPSKRLDGTSPQREHGGEPRARARFGSWLPHSKSYGNSRDALAVAGTSRISEALHFGELSALEVVQAAEEHGADAFVRQIAWRDFNYQLLFHRPDLARVDLRSATFQPALDHVSVDAWKRGRTGYPVVDAGMRQLRATGWMHNRTRMLTASFLTKHLLQDWRIGARWFQVWLTDGDIANNQLGWQWVAGTGVDTNPWRMFNPTLQSRKYDPAGTYIRTWVPELADASVQEIHDPSPSLRESVGYPEGIVEHSDAVERFKHRERSTYA
jgi:deoxyribodipyrimidine photo-lyase